LSKNTYTLIYLFCVSNFVITSFLLNSASITLKYYFNVELKMQLHNWIEIETVQLYW